MLTLIAIITIAASPEPSLPAPRFAALPTPKFVATGCACTVCDCATCDGSCAAATRNNAGEWVVKLNGRTFTVSTKETKETAVRLAKEVAGEKVGTPSPVLPSIQSLMTPMTYANCPNGQCPNVAPARRGR